MHGEAYLLCLGMNPHGEMHDAGTTGQNVRCVAVTESGRPFLEGQPNQLAHDVVQIIGTHDAPPLPHL